MVILPKTKKRQRRPRSRSMACKPKTAYTGFFHGVQYGPSLYQGVFAGILGIDFQGKKGEKADQLNALFEPPEKQFKYLKKTVAKKGGTVGDVLQSFWDSPKPKLWIFKEDDTYTQHVRNWVHVKKLVSMAQDNLSYNCRFWESNRRTDSKWKPSMTTPPNGMPPNSWSKWKSRPSGTSPLDASRAYAQYLTQGMYIWNDYDATPETLWTSAIGSFGIWVTVDKIDCACKSAKMNIWMYNKMSKKSFGSFGIWLPKFMYKQEDQFMWWNWKVDYRWSKQFGWDGNYGEASSPGGWGWD